MKRVASAFCIAFLLLPTPSFSLHILRFISSSQSRERTHRTGASAFAAFNNKNTSATPIATTSVADGGASRNKIRGDRYGVHNNSTIPTPEDAAISVGVRPPIRTSVKTWKRAWRLHGAALPILHAFDSCRPEDSSLSLRCLWLKALSGNDPSSPAFDDGLAFDLLPPVFRSIVGRRVRWLYPRLHHANIETRTAFLDRAIDSIVSSVRGEDERSSNYGNEEARNVRLVSLGAGYDVRSVKFIERQMVDGAFELDLPRVVEAKRLLLGPKRLLRRRPWLKEENLPRLIPVDLNEVEDLKSILKGILTSSSKDTWQKWHTIFVFEGVMIYLDEGVPSSLLGLCSDVLKEHQLDGSLCFADRLENCPGGERRFAETELLKNGWELDEWRPKPGLARHAGSAKLRKEGRIPN